MTAPWDAERVVSAELASDLVEAQFPQLAPAVARPLGVGWDNTAFVVNHEWVFRFPRRPIAVNLLATETRLLPAIAPRVPLAVPVPELIGRPDDRFGWPFAGYRLLPGRTACAAGLDEAQRHAAAALLGRFMRALHAFPASEAGRLGAPPDLIGRLALAGRAAETRGRLERIGALGLVADVRPLLRLHDGVADARAPRTTTLVHGDLYACHLLVGEGAVVTGVIDWGDVHVGDPAVDLMTAHWFLPPAARGAFLEAYGQVDGDTWRLARLRALHHAAAVVVYGHDVGNAGLLREGLTALRYVAA